MFSSKLLAIARKAAERKEPASLFLMMEAHFGHVELADTVMPSLQRVAKVYRDADLECPLVFVTRIRDPLAYYISFFKWGVAFRQRKDPVTYGNNFSAWASRVPNLQSSIMMRGMSSVQAEYHGRFHSRSYVDYDQLKRTLDQFSVVGTVERFDETLLLAADLVGLPLLRYKRTSKSICPDMDACRRLIREVAPLDHMMYDKYASRFEEKLQALGPAFAERVAMLKKDVAEAQPIWLKAPRKQTICRYHPESSTHERTLRLDNIRCPVHDPTIELDTFCQSVYARRLFECPWQFKPNSSLSDPLGCWRPAT